MKKSGFDQITVCMTESMLLQAAVLPQTLIASMITLLRFFAKVTLLVHLLF